MKKQNQKREVFECAACGWTGTKPSITDASEVVDGEMDRRHEPLCPKCFARVALRAAEVTADPRIARVEAVVKKMEAERSVRADRWAARLRAALKL